MAIPDRAARRCYPPHQTINPQSTRPVDTTSIKAPRCRPASPTGEFSMLHTSTATAVAIAALVLALQQTVARAEPTLPPLSCSFKAGAAWSYTGGAYTSAQPEPLAFDIEAIDLESQTARLSIAGKPVGNPLRVVRALNANHFLEVAQEGFLNVTTIYDQDRAVGRRPAIHSRHLGVLGQPLFAQYAGFCAAK